jgi:hypothetical protein
MEAMEAMEAILSEERTEWMPLIPGPLLPASGLTMALYFIMSAEDFSTN